MRRSWFIGIAGALSLVGAAKGYAAQEQVGAAETKLDREDKDFFKEANLGGRFEVQAGQLAQQKAQSPEVKDFARRMVADHGKANNDLRQVASSKGLKLATELDDEKKQMLDDLDAKKGKEFDKAYIDHMVDDHEADVRDFRKASEEATDPELRSWASETLPVLEEHLRQAKQIQEQLE